jgi:hypothetical protein
MPVSSFLASVRTELRTRRYSEVSSATQNTINCVTQHKCLSLCF